MATSNIVGSFFFISISTADSSTTVSSITILICTIYPEKQGMQNSVNHLQPTPEARDIYIPNLATENPGDA